MGVSPFTAVIPTGAVNVDLSSTDHDLTAEIGNCYGLYIGSTGDVIANLKDQPNTDITFSNLPQGEILAGRFLNIVRTDTTATNIVALMVKRGHQI